MNKYTLTLLSVASIAFLSLFNVSLAKAQQGEEIFFADPTIFTENGKYYLTGTRNKAPLGFSVLESTNLTDWETPSDKGVHMLLEPGKDVFGERGFWAPQILKDKGKYFLTYTANEQVVIASSNTLTGRYSQTVAEPIDGSKKNIDSYIFKDDDGKYYLYHVRFNRGNFLWVAEFDFKAGKIKPETLKQCFSNTDPWETTPNYKSDPIMEGPTVIKLNGIYYLFYSANHFMNIDYAVGYATATSPYGPWKKHPNNPIIHRSIVGENGSGHGDIFYDNKNQPYYVYHVHYSDTQVTPRRTRIVPLEFTSDPNSTDNIYSITVKSDQVIKPVHK